jgi:hypothetical protein
MGIFFTALLIGLIPAFIAQSKGRNFVIWYIYGVLLFIFAFIHSLIIKPTAKQREKDRIADGLKKCPFCAEYIKFDAKVCRYCGKEVEK